MSQIPAKAVMFANDRIELNHPVDRLAGYRTLRPIRTRGLPRELLAVREGTAGFRRLCSLRFAPNDDLAGEMLAREASILARLHHPTILPAFDLLEVDGWRVLVLAFEGVFTVDRISAALRKQPVRLDTQAALFVAHRVFDALAHAHGKTDTMDAPLVHGDIHPANIIVRRDGHVLLRGFRGSAPLRVVATDERLALGPYAAPELAQGRPATIQSDVYEAAAVIWELFVGQALPDGEVPSLAVTRPDLPAELAAVFDVCLSSDPDARRIRASTVVATLRKAVDLHGGRECLERLYVRVLRRLPASVRALCAGTLPPRLQEESSSPTQRYRRDEARTPGVLLVGHPTHPLHHPIPRRGTVGLDADLRLSDDVFDDEPPTLRQVSPVSVDDREADDDDTIVHVRAESLLPPAFDDVTDPAFDVGKEERWGMIDGAKFARDAFATTVPTLAPRSFPPVSADPESAESRATADAGADRRTGLTIGIGLLLAPLAWMAGQYGAGPLWTSLSNPTTSLSSMSASSVTSPGTDRSLEFPSRSEPAETAPVLTASAVQPPIPLHQAMVRVEGPPDGVVYVNGVAVGRTGERSLTRSCGLRFVRVGTEAKGTTLHGVRWLSKGQTAKLPCGTSVNLRAKPLR